MMVYEIVDLDRCDSRLCHWAADLLREQQAKLTNIRLHWQEGIGELKTPWHRKMAELVGDVDGLYEAVIEPVQNEYIVPDWDNMTPKDVRAYCDKISRHAFEWGEIKATLQLACMEGRPLHRLNIRYDSTVSVINNLVNILKALAHETAEE